MRVTVRQRIDMLRRSFPHIAANRARYLYAKPADMDRTGRMVAVWCMMESTDGRTSMHKTTFSNKAALSVPEWATQLDTRAPEVFRDYVVPAINDQSGTMWVIKMIVGWHFVKPPTKRERAQRKVQEKVSHAKLSRQKGARK